MYGSFIAPLGRHGRIEFDPEYSREKWKGNRFVEARDREMVGGTLALRWNFRSLEFRGGASLFRIRRPDNTGMYDRFFLRVRRYF